MQTSLCVKVVDTIGEVAEFDDVGVLAGEEGELGLTKTAIM